MWLLSLVLAGVFVLFVHYALSRAEAGPSSSPVSMPVVALAAVFVLAAVGGVVAIQFGGDPAPLTVASDGSPTATPAPTATPTPTATPAPSPTATPRPSTPTAGSDAADASPTLVHVADGDTVTLRYADGRLETYALAGVDAPETGAAANDPGSFEGVLTGSRGRTCLAEFGRRATVFLRTTYLDRPVEVSTVDGASGLRAYVSVDGRSLNRRLVARGYARADGDYATPEARARAGDIGLWSCGVVSVPPTDDDGVAITAVHPNPDGDDATHLNGEYVVVENLGTEPVHPGNWYLLVDGRRYGFLGTHELLPGQSMTVHAGSGRNAPTDRYLGANAPLLDNDHATIVLRDGDNTRNVSLSY